MKRKLKKETPKALNILSTLYWALGGMSLLWGIYYLSTPHTLFSLLELLFFPSGSAFLGMVMIFIGVALWKRWTYTRTVVITFLPIFLLLGIGYYLFPAFLMGFGGGGSSALTNFFIGLLGWLLVLGYIFINFLNIVTIKYLAVKCNPPKKN